MPATVRVAEVCRVDDAEVARLVGLPALVLPARLEGPLVRVRAADYLDEREALGLAVGGQFLEALPGQALAQALPPGVAEPEEGRAVGVDEVAAVRAHPQRAVAIERVVAPVGDHLEFALDAVEPGVGPVGTLGPPGHLADLARGVAEAPTVPARPEARHPDFGAVGLGDDCLELCLDERVPIGLLGQERDLGHSVRLDTLRRPDRRVRRRQRHHGNDEQANEKRNGEVHYGPLRL